LLRIGLVPAPVKVLGHHPELDHQIRREVLWLNLSALLAPEAKEGLFVIAHDDPGVRASDEISTTSLSIRRCSYHAYLQEMIVF
jgi:hypothetical protein